MRRVIISLIFIVILILGIRKAYSHNPLLKEKNKSISQTKNLNHFYPSLYKNFMNKIILVQKEFNEKLSEFVDEIKKGSKKAILMIIIFSFFYGIIHAAGPGHGKTLVASYFFSRQAPFLKGIMAGILIAVTHSFSAVIIIGMIYLYIQKSTLVNFEKYTHYIKTVSYSIIILVGVFMLIKIIYSVYKRKFFSKKSNNLEENENRSFAAIVFAAGIIPCPGAAMIFIFSLNEGVFLSGIISVAFMSLGIATTISIVIAIVIASKKAGFSFLSGSEKSKKIFQLSTEIISAFIILFAGVILFLANN